MLRNVLYLASVCELTAGEAIAIATGNTAKAHGLDAGILREGAPADLIVCGRVEGSSGSTLADAISHGDLPGISYVLVDGEITVDGRSRQTPPPSTSGRFVTARGGELSTMTVLLAGCCGAN
jgi:enamidase